MALVGQDFMPAQELHVLEDQGKHVLDGVWFVLPEAGESLNTPSWKPFERSDLLGPPAVLIPDPQTSMTHRMNLEDGWRANLDEVFE